jgi:SPOR domain
MNEFDQSNLNDPVDQEPGSHLHIPNRKGRFFDLLKSLILFLLLVALIVGSFWISFNLGKRILSPVKKSSDMKIDIAIPEPPASIAEFQSIEEVTIEGAALVEEIEADVEVSESSPASSVYDPNRKYYKIQAGFFNVKSNAINLSNKLKANGFSTFIRKIGKGYRVQVGAYDRKSWAKLQKNRLMKKGFDSVIIYE